MKLCIASACALLAVCSVRAEEVLESGFVSDQLSIGMDHIYTVSSFDSIDYFCTYDQSGNLVWEIPFGSKIISWKTKDDSLFIFSKNRNGMTYFLTCVACNNGELKWEKTIFAPMPVQPSDVPQEDLDS